MKHTLPVAGDRLSAVLMRLNRWLIDPWSSDLSSDDRRKARFLALMLVLSVPLALAVTAVSMMSWGQPFTSFTTAPRVYIMLFATPATLIAYILSRTRYYLWAVAMMMMVIWAAVLISTLVSSSLSGLDAAFYLILPVLISSVLLSLRTTLWVAIANIVFLLLLPAVPPGPVWADGPLQPLRFTIIVSLFVVLVAYYRDTRETDRRRDLAQNEARLQQAYDGLEERIAARTIELLSANTRLKEQISERERAERVLEAERHLLRTLIDNLPDHIFVKDTQGRFLLVNEAAAHYLRVEKPEQAIGKTDFDFFSREEAVYFQAAEQKIFQTGEALINGEYRLTDEHGNPRYALGMRVPLRDNANAVIGLVGIDRDITERKHAEQHLQDVRAELERQVAERTDWLSETNARLWRQIAERQQAEDQLRYQANLLQNVSDAIISTDMNLKIQSWNRAAEKIYGWRAEEVIGKAVNVITQSAQSEMIQQTQVAEFWDKGYSEGETIHLRKDGTPVHLLVSTSLVRDASGTSLGIVSVNRDMTERKLAQTAELEQRNLADALREMVATLNSTLDLDVVLNSILVRVEQVLPCDTTNIMLIEKDMARVFCHQGYTERGLDLDGFSLILEQTPVLYQMYRTGQPFIVLDTQTFAGWRPYPQTNWIRSYIGIPIRIGQDVIGFLNLDSAQPNALADADLRSLQAFTDQASLAIRNARHATELERRVAERTAELESERARLQTILDAMDEGVMGVMLGTDERPISRFTNRAFSQLTGYTADEWSLEKLRTQEMPRVDTSAINAAFHETLRRKGIWRIEAKIRRKDGSEFDAYMTNTRVNDPEGHMIGTVMVLRDISQEKALQEMKSRFVAVASHELRTPITNLITRLWLLRKQPEKADAHLASVEEIANRVRLLVEDLLDLSRFERGIIELHLQPMDLRQLVSDVVRLQQPEAERKSIEIVYDPPNTTAIIMGDALRIYQVITNLITNAINYTPPDGTIRVSVGPETDSASGEVLLAVHVQDSGVGIAPEHQASIFQPFYRANEHTRGTGLGLTIAQEIVDLHGGQISVESQLGKGSRFSVRFKSLLADSQVNHPA